MKNKPDLKSRLEKALRENLRKRKVQQRERNDKNPEIVKANNSKTESS
jgi:hypothetical protein